MSEMVRTMAARSQLSSFSNRIARWRQIFRRREKSRKTNGKMRLRISEPEVEDHLLTAEFENLSSKMSTLCISQDFVSEMREAFYLFDKVFLTYLSDHCSNQFFLSGPERLYLFQRAGSSPQNSRLQSN